VPAGERRTDAAIETSARVCAGNRSTAGAGAGRGERHCCRGAGQKWCFANVAYGNGLRGDERYGMVRLAALGPITENIQIGVDSTATFDLELDADEPLGEPERDIQVAPTATLCLDAAVLSAQAGVSVLELRFEEPRVGSVVLLGAGGAF
jgi:hypothetical protein